MYKISVHMGVCAVSKINTGASYWTVLDHYGISQGDLKKMDLSYEELYEIYTNIQQHEKVREFLKRLKEKITHFS